MYTFICSICFLAFFRTDSFSIYICLHSSGVKMKDYTVINIPSLSSLDTRCIPQRQSVLSVSLFSQGYFM